MFFQQKNLNGSNQVSADWTTFKIRQGQMSTLPPSKLRYWVHIRGRQVSGAAKYFRKINFKNDVPNEKK
jgi:hypothetical protein